MALLKAFLTSGFMHRIHMPVAFPGWHYMLVVLQYWGFGGSSTFIAAFGIALVGTLHHPLKSKWKKSCLQHSCTLCSCRISTMWTLPRLTTCTSRVAAWAAPGLAWATAGVPKRHGARMWKAELLGSNCSKPWGPRVPWIHVFKSFCP